MDDRQKPSKRKPAKSAHPSQEEKEAMTVTLEKARLKDERPAVQSSPLEPPNFEPPAGDLGTAAPPLEYSSEVAAAPNADMDYDYGGCYGGYQAPRFNSTLLNDRECDSRAEYFHHVFCQRPDMRHIWCLSPTLTHMAKAIVRPAPRSRERVQCRERSTGCSRFWKATSMPRAPPSPSKPLSVRVSCSINFVEIFRI
jgi:hypothetical protein